MTAYCLLGRLSAFLMVSASLLIGPATLHAAQEPSNAPATAPSTPSTPSPATSSDTTLTNPPAQPSAANTIQRSTEIITIDASWPTIGIARVDEESKAFVESLVANFEQESKDAAAEMVEFRKQLEAEGTTPEDMPPPYIYELNVSYETDMPTDRVASIVWRVWTYTGGAHGQLAIVSNNYDLTNGFPLLLEDLFIDPQLALLEFSKVSRKVLAQQDAEKDAESSDNFMDEMLRAGTEPTEENFATFSILPDGMRLYFQPYQVAPWAAGPQTVDVPLDDLKNAKPKLAYWGK